jgi:flavin-dependent dehydrogenase
MPRPRQASPAVKTDWTPQSTGIAPLEPGARVAVIGGGPAGSMFGYFLREFAERLDVGVDVTIFEPRDFSGVGPAACNMCGGIISESLVQALATEGINLPATVVQRGIDSYVLHMDVGSVRIATPLDEKRIGAVHRASGPRDLKEARWASFDGFLQQLATQHGVTVVRDKVTELHMDGERPRLVVGGETREFDLVAVATGVNAASLKLVESTPRYEVPKTTKTFIREYFLGEELIGRQLGSSMHVFLLPIPNLEFAAIIPKGDYASVCLLGEGLDKNTYEAFVTSPEVRALMPQDWDPLKNSCQCSPKISVLGARRPFANRVVFIGDSGSTRLYKDGIGAAYRTSKAAARTVMFHGVAEKDFEEHYWPACERIEKDNAIGRFMFGMTTQVQRSARTRRALLNMTAAEQTRPGEKRRMSAVLWDMFTGSSSYREIMVRAMHPAFVSRLGWNLARSALGERPVIHPNGGRDAA